MLDIYKNYGSYLPPNSTIVLSEKKPSSAKVANAHVWSYLMLKIENMPNREVNCQCLLYLESKWKILHWSLILLLASTFYRMYLAFSFLKCWSSCITNFLSDFLLPFPDQTFWTAVFKQLQQLGDQTLRLFGEHILPG